MTIYRQIDLINAGMQGALKKKPHIDTSLNY